MTCDPRRRVGDGRIKSDVVIGAVGASGGTVDQDLKVAEAAVSSDHHV
jgi:uncharacterized protein GlcG (DUF336 family)